MRLFGYMLGGMLTVIGLLSLMVALGRAMNINLFNWNNGAEGNGVLGIALAAIPLVLGLLVLAKLQEGKKVDATDPAQSDDSETL